MTKLRESQDKNIGQCMVISAPISAETEAETQTEITAPSAPCLDRLFGPTALDRWVASRQMAENDQLAPAEVNGIESTRLCTRCHGVGRARRRRPSASDNPATVRSRARNARKPRPCKSCDGKGYRNLDARPGPTQFSEPHYTTPDPPAHELRNARAVRAMPTLAREVGARWATPDARAHRLDPGEHPLAPLYPLTYAGRLLNVTRQLHYASAAHEQARALLLWAERCARIALGVQIRECPISEGTVIGRPN